MEWQRYSSGSAFEERYGYSRAVFDDEWVSLAGTTGFDYSTMTLPEGAGDQTRQTIRNLAATLAECGSSLAEIYHYRLIVSAREHVEAALEAIAEELPGAPTATLLIAELIQPEIKVEIEAHARKGWTT